MIKVIGGEHRQPLRQGIKTGGDARLRAAVAHQTAISAVAQHQRTLVAYPNSAWARYELFFSTITRDGLDTKKKIKRANKLWDESAPEIFRCNPLYTSQFGATRGKTVGAMLDRLALHRIANKPPEDFGERIGSFADAALRLGLSLPAAKSRVQRARLRLRAQLAEACQVTFDDKGKVCCFVPRPPLKLAIAE